MAQAEGQSDQRGEVMASRLSHADKNVHCAGQRDLDKRAGIKRNNSTDSVMLTLGEKLALRPLLYLPI